VIWSGDWPVDPGDGAIMARALAEDRILASFLQVGERDLSIAHK
jgi:hypothetical protein